MIDHERKAAYEICKERGHAPSDKVLASNPPWNVCKYCGTHYRWSEPEMVEANLPKGVVP